MRSGSTWSNTTALPSQALNKRRAHSSGGYDVQLATSNSAPIGGEVRVGDSAALGQLELLPGGRRMARSTAAFAAAYAAAYFAEFPIAAAATLAARRLQVSSVACR